MAGCQSGPPRARALGEAFVGPPTLNLRSDIPTQSSTVAVVKHGDRVEILDQRRSFLKVRAPRGAEGWTEQKQLLGAADMAGLKALAQEAATLPSQGIATTDVELRVHIQPASSAPSFLALKANDKVDVLTHIRRDRTDLPRRPLLAPPAKRTKAKKPAKVGAFPPPPAPAPPTPPPNWLELSKSELPEEDAAEKSNAPPAPTDSWSLVRTPDGQSGWVLTRRLRMAIPDDVAQYAEGHAIVSYFPLGPVRDGDQEKQSWLWTTVSSGPHDYDFDSFRVFVWNSRRHRYETEYIEHNVIGYAPVELQQTQLPGAKGKAASEVHAGFSVCVEKKDGQLYRRHYAFLNPVVRFSGEEACQLPAPIPFGEAGAPPSAASAPAPKPTESALQRIKRRVKALTGGWFKH